MFCFAAGTAIATAQGPEAIETLTPGRVVLSYDVRLGRLVEGRVSAVLVHPRKRIGRLSFADGRVLRMTEEHPVYAVDRGDFVPASTMPAGARALALHPAAGVVALPADGAYAALADLQPVYNLTVDGQHNYFAEGVLVHNKSPCPPCGCPPCREVCRIKTSGTEAEPDLIARRLMALIWAEIDPKVLDDVASGALSLRGADARRKIVARMLAHPRAREGTRRFVARWLGLDHARPPQVSEALWSSLREETLRFSTEALFATGRNLDELLLANYTFLDRTLSQHYGIPGGSDGFSKVMVDPAVRVGLLTQGALLAAHPNPTARGDLVHRELLGCFESLLLPNDHPARSDRTPARGVLEPAVKASASCVGCHDLFDGPGWALHAYDELGRIRTLDTDGAPIDTRGWIDARTAPVVGPQDLAKRIASVRPAGDCLARRLIEHAEVVAGVSLQEPTKDCWTSWTASGRYTDLIQDVAELLALAVSRDDGGVPPLADAPQDVPLSDAGSGLDAAVDGG